MGTVNVRDLEWAEIDKGTTCFKRKHLGEAADGIELGCSLYELPAGGQSWPYHHHTANEEAVFVLSGEGTLRLAGENIRLVEGDYVALPANEDGAHRIINDSDDPLSYLMVSTMNDPDVTVYPDSNKAGIFVGSPPGGRGTRTLHEYFRLDDAVNYWSGENDENTEDPQ